MPQGQYGPYPPGGEKHLRLDSGKALDIYRVKYWTFGSGDPPALQLEYEALGSLQDVPALRQTARELWPAFAPYVEALDLDHAIITATKLRRYGLIGFWWVRTNHFGLVVSRDSTGTWRFADDRSPLPPADYARGPQITEPSGSPLPVSRERPKILP